MRRFVWFTAVLAAFASVGDASLNEELLETERMIALQEAKLSQLRQMRLSLTNDGQSESLHHSITPSVPSNPAPSASFHSHFLARQELALSGDVVAMQTLQVNAASWLFTATQQGQLTFHRLPTCAVTTTFDIGLFPVLSATVVQSEDPTRSTLSVVTSSQMVELNLTWSPQSNWTYVPVSSRELGDTASLAASTFYRGDFFHFAATENGKVGVFGANTTLQHTITALSTPPRVLKPYRHLLTASQDSSVWLFPIARLEDQVHYVCEGSRANITAVAFDATSANIMYAGLETSEVLVFDLFADRTRQCRLLHRFGHPGAALHSMATVPGYLLVASSDDIRVYNITEIGTRRPVFVAGKQRQNPTNSESAHLALAPSIDTDEERSMQRHTVALALGSSVTLFESMLPEPVAPSGTSDLWWARLPLVLVVAVCVIVVRIVWQKSPDVGQMPSLEDKLRKEMGMDDYEPSTAPHHGFRSTTRPPSKESSTSAGSRRSDPTFDPSEAASMYNRRQTEVY